MYRPLFLCFWNSDHNFVFLAFHFISLGRAGPGRVMSCSYWPNSLVKIDINLWVFFSCLLCQTDSLSKLLDSAVTFTPVTSPSATMHALRSDRPIADIQRWRETRFAPHHLEVWIGSKFVHRTPKEEGVHFRLQPLHIGEWIPVSGRSGGERGG